MAQLKTYHVRAHDDGWAVQGTGAQRPSAVEAKKADAVQRAREIAQNQEPAKVIVHKQDGTVQDEFNYGDVGAASGDGQATEAEGPGADAAYVLAALAKDALQLASEALRLTRELPSRAQERGRELRDLKARREELNEQLRELRNTLEQRLDEKSAQGRSVADGVLSDERVRRVIDQAKTAQSQVKAALTSIRKTGEEAASGAAQAGKEQARTAKSQVKAAATSVRKTGEAAADAGKDVSDE